MKKRMFHKGMAAVLAVSLTTGGALPFMAQTVHAEDTADYKLSYRNSDCVHTAGGQ